MGLDCHRCDDYGWVCENQPGRPWQGPHAFNCGGVGAPCPICNSSTGDEIPMLAAIRKEQI